MTSIQTLRKWMETEVDVLFDIQMLRAQAAFCQDRFRHEKYVAKIANRERDLEKLRLRRLGIDPKRGSLTFL